MGCRVTHQVPEGKEVHARMLLGQPHVHFSHSMPLPPAPAIGDLTGALRSFPDTVNTRRGVEGPVAQQEQMGPLGARGVTQRGEKSLLTGEHGLADGVCEVTPRAEHAAFDLPLSLNGRHKAVVQLPCPMQHCRDVA